MTLTKRVSGTRLHLTVTELVGKVLLDRPDQELRISQVADIIASMPGNENRYTEGQVKGALIWQLENNSLVIKSRVLERLKIRVYKYDSSAVKSDQ